MMPAVTDVVVVGAGPTGLMLANWLVKLGLGVTVLDTKTGPTRESRAVGVQARTVEIYDQLGIIDQVPAEAEVAEAIAPGFERTVFARIAFGALGRGTTPYPHLYVLEQSKNEQLLYDNLLRLGGTVSWQHRVPAVSTATNDATSSAMVTADGPEGEVTYQARYCVGTSSAVRTHRGIAFDGITNAQTFYVADATAVRGLVAHAVNVRLASADFLPRPSVRLSRPWSAKRLLLGSCSTWVANPGCRDSWPRSVLPVFR